MSDFGDFGGFLRYLCKVKKKKKKDKDEKSLIYIYIDSKMSDNSISTNMKRRFANN